MSIGLCVCLAVAAVGRHIHKHVETPVAGADFLPIPIQVSVTTSAIADRAFISTPSGPIPYQPK